MADNSAYKFGIDYYYQNRIPALPTLTAWNKMINFVLFRIGVGVLEDDLTKLFDAAHNTSWDLGVYYELWTPLLPKEKMLTAITHQLAKVREIITLPVALAFEPESDYIKGRKVTQWPSVGDLKYLATSLANLGYRVMVYTNLSGLEIIKASGIIDMASVDWWISRYYDFPLWNIEMGVDATLAILQTKYGIPKERVLFMQTVGDHGAYPDGTTGADYDRAVSWTFGAPVTPPPVPVPNPEPVPVPVPPEIRVPKVVISDVLIRDGGQIVGGIMDQSTVYGVINGNNLDLRGSISLSVLKDPAAELPPPPPVVPPPTIGLSALRRRDQCISWDSRYDWNGSFSMIGGRGQTNWIELGQHEIDFICSLPDNRDLWKWAATSNAGTIYIDRDDVLHTVKWPIILLSSTYDQIQMVARLADAGGYTKIGAIPYQANGDYSAFTPDKHPEFWLWAYTDYKGGGYGPSHTLPDGRSLTFRMPLFDPIGFPKISADAKAFAGFWVDQRVFA